MKITDAIDGIQIAMENSDVFVIGKCDTLSETREAFLEFMGRQFDKKFYEALRREPRPEERLSITKQELLRITGCKNLNELKEYLYEGN